ncbi:DUF6261 family protein [Flavobacterium sp. SM2513]|uniref:DUF6261 family protein n=1 Tax=Flavobacterium sp. SM2513 TaxID=3424766 RepID=UPI003D7F3E9B
MQLYPISTTRLQVIEAGQFINRYIEDVTNSGQVLTTDPEFKIQFDKIKAINIPYNEALLQVKARAETLALLELDLRRDRKVLVIRRFTSAYEYTDDPGELAAYREINVILRKYKNVEKDNYETESLAITNMIIEIRGAQDNAMDALNLKRHVDNLEVANDEFKTMFANRSTEIGSTVEYDTNALRKEIFVVYNKLANYVLMMADYKGTPFFLDMLRRVNTGREYYADIIARREGVNKKNNANK